MPIVFPTGLRLRYLFRIPSSSLLCSGQLLNAIVVDWAPAMVLVRSMPIVFPTGLRLRYLLRRLPSSTTELRLRCLFLMPPLSTSCVGSTLGYRPGPHPGLQCLPSGSREYTQRCLDAINFSPALFILDSGTISIHNPTIEIYIPKIVTFIRCLFLW
jgi:hypothetical protein